MSKKCSCCGEEKPISEFNRFKRSSDGFQAWCKKCKRLADRQRRPQQREWAQQRSETDEWRSYRSGVQRRYRRRHPKTMEAHLLVKRAIRSGVLVRPESCNRCGTGGRIEASHDDYDKPLEVEWLCRACHAAKDLRIDA